MGRLALALIVLALLAALTPPPARALELELGGAGWSRLMEGDRDLGRADELNESVDFLRRRPLADGPLYWGWGARQELYSFGAREGFPLARLQDYAGQLSLEYVLAGQTVAAVTLRPGFYFESVPVLRAWDVPFDAYTGIPLSGPVNGVIGVGYGRFYRRPTPVVGLIWTPSPKIQVKAIYPEPAIEIQLPDGSDARLGAELLGGGFRSDSIAGHPSVEYVGYRLGFLITRPARGGVKISFGAGYQIRRTFEFEGGRRLRSGDAPSVEFGARF